MPPRHNLPVSDPAFWKKRIEEAGKSGRLHHSVYVSSDALWDTIFRAHMGVLDKEVPPGSSLLDIGCGYGRFAPMFENYTGVDISPDLIEIAKSTYPSKKFVIADLRSLPFKDKEFDVGILVSVRAMIIGNLGGEAWEPMEKECKRVCKKVIALEYGTFEDYHDTFETMSKYEIL